MYPTVVAGVGTGPEATVPLATKGVELAIEATPISRQTPASEVPAIDKGKGDFTPAPKEKPAPPTKPNGIVIGVPVAPSGPASKEEGPVLRGDTLFLHLLERL